MRQNYLFAPIIILVMLFASLIGGYAYGQNNPNQGIQVQKKVISNGDSVKIIIETIAIDDSNTFLNDSIINLTIQNHLDGENHFIQVINGDTLISKQWNDSLNHLWMDKFHKDQFTDLEAEIKSHVEFLNDSCAHFSFNFEFDSIADFTQFIHSGFVTDEKGNAINFEKYIDVEHMGDSIEKQIKLILGDLDTEMFMIEDFSNHSMNHKHQRIILDELSPDDEKTLANKGLKAGSKEPEFDFFKLYPNPTADAVNLSFQLSETGNIEIRVLNMLGQVVYEEKIKKLDKPYSERISLGEENGPFVMQIIQGNKVTSRKIIIEK